jgi:hypothetical protein
MPRGIHIQHHCCGTVGTFVEQFHFGRRLPESAIGDGQRRGQRSVARLAPYREPR